jgi:SAM-dependent MidA family methyltransferase
MHPGPPPPLPGPLKLPEPSPEAREHSARVVDAIRVDIERSGGWIPFDRYMQLALYAPGLGYYVAGARKFGVEGDFVTAPELTPLFGATLACQVADILAVSERREVVELGAGSGVLARDLLRALKARGSSPSHYAIVEPSAELRERQRETLSRLAGELDVPIEWSMDLPSRVDGAMLLNEVLDAIPAHCVRRERGNYFERGVAWRDGFQFDVRRLDEGPLQELAAKRFPRDIDYSSEINPAAEALVETLACRLVRGAVVIIDYGFPRAELYHPQRREGTQMGHYRHRAHGDPFLWPGLSDLTTHVDFTAMAEAGERGGLDVAGFAPQGAFLLGCGLLDCLSAVGPPESLAYLREASAVQKLTSPAEMGELFKVLALAKGERIAWPGFSLVNAAHRL